MLNLMKLELRKHSLKGNIAGAFIAILVMMAVVILINYEKPMGNYEEVFALTNSASFIFIIFASVLLSKLIISEYKAKTVTVMFMYPLSRKKLILAKIAIVVLFTFVFGILARVAIFSGFYIYNQFAHFVAEDLTRSVLVTKGLGFVVDSAMTSCIGLAPLYFGMRKYSVTATMVSGVTLMAVLNAGSGTDFAVSSILVIPISIAVIGIVVAYLAIRNVDVRDVV